MKPYGMKKYGEINHIGTCTLKKFNSWKLLNLAQIIMTLVSWCGG